MMRDSNETLLQQRAHSSAELFIAMIKDPVVSYDLATLEASIEQLLTGTGMAYVKVWNYNQYLSGGGELTLSQSQDQPSQKLGFVNERSLYRVVAPIEIAEQNYGQVEIGIHAKEMQATLTETIKKASIISVVEIILSALFSLLLGNWLVRQLNDLRDAAEAISDGKYGTQITVRGKDELAQTTKLFNTMSLDLKSYTDNLEQLNATLEQKVADRTNDLKLSNHYLNTVIENMSDGLVIIDEEGKVTKANPAFLNLAKLPLDTSVTEYHIQQWLISKGLQTMDIIQSKGADQHEMQLRTVTDGDVPVWVHSNRIIVGEQPIWLINVQDLRALKRAEQIHNNEAFAQGIEENKIDTLLNTTKFIKDINEQTHIAEQKAHLLKRLAKGLHNYAHLIAAELTHLPDDKQFKNLHSIGNLLESVENSLLDYTQTGIIEPNSNIANSVKELSEWFDLPPSTTSPGKDTITFSLHHLIDDVSMQLFTEIQSNQCQLINQVEQDILVRGVPKSQFLNACKAMISNAVEAMHHGGDIIILAEQADDFLRLTINDSGTGINESLLENIAELGYHNKRADVGRGVKDTLNFLHLLGGELSMQNRPEGGLQVVMVIPTYAGVLR